MCKSEMDGILETYFIKPSRTTPKLVNSGSVTFERHHQPNIFADSNSLEDT